MTKKKTPQSFTPLRAVKDESPKEVPVEEVVPEVEPEAPAVEEAPVVEAPVEEAPVKKAPEPKKAPEDPNADHPLAKYAEKVRKAAEKRAKKN